ncbi:MAG: type VI secretion system baseplate subunit TssK [Thermodesulfobacteriota bacterium]
MISEQKVVWAEGVFLGQQHFQQWDRQIEASQNFKNRVHPSFPWGVYSLAIDDKLLEKGRFQVQECLAVLANGQNIRYRADQGPALHCDLGGHGGDTIEIFICLPGNGEISGISGYSDTAKLSAWRADYAQLADEHDPAREREVLLASPNLQLMTASDPLEKYVTLKIAEVFNKGDGSYRLVDDFVPPAVRIGGAPQLGRQLNRIIEQLRAKISSLSERLRFGTGGPAEFARQEPANFALLQVLNATLPQLVHFQQHQDLHPEPLYRTLCQAMGTLCTFSPEADANKIPVYRHTDLRQFLSSFEQVLGSIVSVTMPSQAASLDLIKESEALLSVSDIDEEILTGSTFFLGVFSDDDNPEWITDFARQVKTCSRDTIEMVVASALPGVKLVHTQRPPAKLATKSGQEYFRLEPRGDFWNKIVEEQSLAVFLPQHFAEATVELVTVQE